MVKGLSKSQNTGKTTVIFKINDFNLFYLNFERANIL